MGAAGDAVAERAAGSGAGALTAPAPEPAPEREGGPGTAPEVHPESGVEAAKATAGATAGAEAADATAEPAQAPAAAPAAPTEAGPEPWAGPEAEARPGAASGPEGGPVAGPAAEAEAVPRPEARPGPQPETGRVAGPDPEPETGPAAETEPSAGPEAGDGRFTVRLANFEGPFDLLLQLITKHKLDVTEVALSQVTDEFMAHLRALGPDGDLDQTTEFLVVAATLLDLKAARLLPAAEVEDEADLALLEARDLLFARLLQYRAYKRIAAIFEERWEAEGRRHPRTVGLEPHHAELLPEVVISIGAEGFARLAVKAMQPKAEPQVYVDHIHAPLVSVREQAAVVVSLLRVRGTALFRELIEDVGDDTLTVVARFLALLELYREKAVALDQETALGDLTVSWTGGETDPTGAVTDEFDQETTQETTA
ncbi:segregation and condensation protein A [Streptomyces aureus]|uniref:segregation and condensation protein A n=1 Tax=Streptomyces aureus TaxID=193461 RepID=UPI0020B113EA|nr:segregation/condensation protein A [Streptomyces aureus]